MPIDKSACLLLLRGTKLLKVRSRPSRLAEFFGVGFRRQVQCGRIRAKS